MTRRSFSSLRVRLFLLVLLAVLPAVGLILYTGVEQRRLAAVAAQENALHLARLASAEQQRLIYGARQLLIALARLPQFSEADPSGCNTLLGNLLKEYQFYTGFTAASPKGDVICSAPPLAQRLNFSDRAWYQRLIRTRDFVIGEYQIGRLSGKPTIILAYPALDAAGQVQAIVTAGLDLTWLNHLAAETQLPSGSTLTLMDRTGTILARFPDPEKWVGKSIPDVPIVRHILSHPGEGTTEAIGLDRILRLYAFTPLTLPGMSQGAAAYVYVGFPTDVAFAEPNRLLAYNLALLGLVAALALAAAWVGGDVFFLRRVNALVGATKRLAAGDLSARTGLSDGPGELNHLARAFDEMAEALERHLAERQRAEEVLRQSGQRLSLHVQQTPLAVIEWDINFRVLKWNSAAERIFGYLEAEALGRHAAELIVPASARGHVDEVWNRLLARKGGERSTNENITNDGRTILCEWYNTPLVTAEGTVIGVASLVQDITEQRQAEEAARRAQARYRQLFEDAPAMYVITRNEGGVPVVAECNILFLETLGYSLAEVLGRPLTDFYTPDGAAKLRDGGYERALAGRFTAEERQLVTRDGRIVETLLQAVPELDPDGKVSGTRAMFTDITARKRTSEAIAQRNRQLEAVRAISEEITQELDLSTLLALVTQRAAELLGVVSGVVFLWDEGAQALISRAWYGQGDWVKGLPFRLGEGVVGTVAERRNGMIVNDYRTSLYAHPRALEETAITTVLAEPLLYQDRLLGVLSVDNRSPGRPFTETDRTILALFASQAAIAIENARLYDATVRQLRELRALHETGLAITSSLTLDEQLEVLVQRLGQAAQAQRILVALVDPGDPERFRLCLAHDAAKPDPWLRHLDLSPGRYPEIQEAIRTGQPQVIPDAAAEARLGAVREHLDLRSLVVVPLIVRERPIGAVSLGYVGQGRTFTREEVSILQSFATQAAIAIEKARLYEELKQAAAHLEAIVEDRTRELRAANQQLQEASRHKSEFLANMSHELRTPLNSILGFSQLLLEQTKEALPAKQNRYLSHIHSSGQHLLQLISDILDLSKVEAGKFVLQPEALPVATTLEDILVIARGLANKKQQEISAQIEADLPPLRADPVRFKQILFNFLSNAVKFTPDGGPITVTARRVAGPPLPVSRHGEFLPTEDRGPGTEIAFLEVSVKDTGVGIKPEDLPRLFQEFVQLETTQEQRHEGTGLGLALTKRLVEMHGGRIWAESEGEGRGSTFTILLPFVGPGTAPDASMEAPAP